MRTVVRQDADAAVRTRCRHRSSAARSSASVGACWRSMHLFASCRRLCITAASPGSDVPGLCCAMVSSRLRTSMSAAARRCDAAALAASGSAVAVSVADAAAAAGAAGASAALPLTAVTAADGADAAWACSVAAELAKFSSSSLFALSAASTPLGLPPCTVLPRHTWQMADDSRHDPHTRRSCRHSSPTSDIIPQHSGRKTDPMHAYNLVNYKRCHNAGGVYHRARQAATPRARVTAAAPARWLLSSPAAPARRRLA